jgi:uncharacterized membrane protein YjjP (DUF1212 family)
MEGRFTDKPTDPVNSSTPEDGASSPSLEPIAMVALDAGRMLMEAGAGAKGVERMVEAFAFGLGADRVDLRIGYASMAITIGIGRNGITRMLKVGNLGVNQRLDQELSLLSKRVSNHEMTLAQTREELTRLAAKTPRHSALVMAMAVGLACAAFGRLLAVDWAATGPIFLAAAIGQFVRRELLARQVNIFICATLVSLLSSVIGGLGARWVGSETITTAMIASILLLVPGVPAVNAQSDILQGHPTLGSARAVSVAMTLIFAAAGLWVGQMLLNQLQ